MTQIKGPRWERGASTNMPRAGPVKITKADGTVTYRPALTYAQRRDRASQSNRRNVSKKLKARIAERDHHTCQECGSTEGPFEVDHIRPYSKGGWNDPTNLRLLCSDCNQRKGAAWDRESKA